MYLPFIVVDLREIPPDAHGPIFEIMKIRITDNILLDLKKRDIETERNKIEKVVSAAISEKKPGQEALQTVFAKITAYLLSDEAEIEFTSRKVTESIAHPIVDTVREKGKISKMQIAAIVRSKTIGLSSDDILFLSESLDRVVFEAIGEARVKKSLNQILSLIPWLFKDRA